LIINAFILYITILLLLLLLLISVNYFKIHVIFINSLYTYTIEILHSVQIGMRLLIQASNCYEFDEQNFVTTPGAALYRDSTLSPARYMDVVSRRLRL